MADYVRHGHRVSLLPVAQYCGLGATLSEQYGAERAAAKSSCYHAMQAKEPRAGELWARLSDKEQADVVEWQRPADIVMGDVVLRYDDAMKEIVLGLDDWGFYVDPASGADCLTIGHADMGWIHDKVAYVGDMKKEVWTTVDGPDSLQLHAYGWALARKFDCDAYCTGLWIATDGEWLWSTEMVVLESPRGREIWDRIYASASNLNQEANRGAHCKNCYARLHCPDYTLPAAFTDTWLAPLLGRDLFATPEEVGRLLLDLQAAEETLDAVRKELVARIKRGELEAVVDGKRYGLVQCKGKRSVDMEKMIAELGAGAKRFIKQGQPYDQPRWLKAV